MDNFVTLKLVEAHKQNRGYLRGLIIISFLLGVNVTEPSRAKDRLRFLNVLLLLFSSFGLYGQYCFIAKHKDEPFATYVECICTSFQANISMIKLAYFLFVQRKIYILFSAAQTGKIVQELQIFDMDLPIALKRQLCLDVIDIFTSSWEFIRRQLLLYSCISGLISSWYFVNGLMLNSYHQFVGTANYTLQTSFPSYFPMWESKGFEFPYYEIQYLSVGCETFLAGFAAISFDGIFIVLTLHGMALLRILQLIIRYSTHVDIEPNLRVTYMRYCIEHFNRTFKYYDEVNSLYRSISLTQFGLSLFILGMVLFQASIGLESDMETFLRMVLYMMAAGFQVLIFCFNGQKLTTESEKLHFAWYNCDWYKESAEFKQMIKMMILRSNRIMPMEISGFKLMNLETFLSILQTSGSYFLLLKNVS